MSSPQSGTFPFSDKETIVVVASNICAGRSVSEIVSQAGYSVDNVPETSNWTVMPLNVAVVILIGSDRQWIESLCSEFRQRTPTVLLVVLGPDDLETKVRLFEVGADAYLVEPFAPAELLATIASLVRARKNVYSTRKLPHK